MRTTLPSDRPNSARRADGAPQAQIVLPDASTPPDTAARPAGTSLVVAATLMFAGAVTWIAAGAADLDLALADGTLDAYLADVAGHRTAALVRLGLWIAGTSAFAFAASHLRHVPSRRPALVRSAAGILGAAAVLAMVSMVAMYVGVERFAVAPVDPVTLPAAEALLAFGTTADWFATGAIVGIAPFLVALAGRDDWAPTWLVRLTAVGAALGVVTVIATFDARAAYGFAVVPVGLAATVATGLVLIRRA